MSRTDVAIVGAGILGLAHAYAFAKRGHKVTVLERHPQAQGASVRNFGMLWAIGQPPGELRALAMRSREIWLELLHEAELWHDPCGSLHLAYAEDELAVLTEFAESTAGLDYDLEIVSPEEVLALNPKLRPERLVGGLFSRQEVCVDPRLTLASLPGFLRDRYGVTFHFSTPATQCGSGWVGNSELRVEADRVLICSGEDFETLYPAVYRDAGVYRSKLQMLRAESLDPELRIQPMLCAGLTLIHYKNFAACPSLPKLRERFERDWPRQIEFGIHVLLSQHGHGQISIGDSHEYGLAVSPFNREEVDEEILIYLDTFLDRTMFRISERWYGVYPITPNRPYLHVSPEPGVEIVGGIGGTGMTLSMGLGDQVALSSIEPVQIR